MTTWSRIRQLNEGIEPEQEAAAPTPEPTPSAEVPDATVDVERERNRQLYEETRLAEGAGDWAGAIAALRQVTLRPGEDVLVHFRLQSLMWRQKAQEHVDLANSALAANRWQKALTHAESALSLWPGMPAAEVIRDAADALMRRRRAVGIATSLGLVFVILGLALAFALIVTFGVSGGTAGIS